MKLTIGKNRRKKHLLRRSIKLIKIEKDTSYQCKEWKGDINIDVVAIKSIKRKYYENSIHINSTT